MVKTIYPSDLVDPNSKYYKLLENDNPNEETIKKILG